VGKVILLGGKNGPSNFDLIAFLLVTLREWIGNKGRQTEKSFRRRSSRLKVWLNLMSKFTSKKAPIDSRNSV
jgi:hypothetical protein